MKTFKVAAWETDKTSDNIIAQLHKIGATKKVANARKQRARKLKKIITKEQAVIKNETTKKVDSGNKNIEFIHNNTKKTKRPRKRKQAYGSTNEMVDVKSNKKLNTEETGTSSNAKEKNKLHKSFLTVSGPSTGTANDSDNMMSSPKKKKKQKKATAIKNSEQTNTFKLAEKIYSNNKQTSKQKSRTSEEKPNQTKQNKKSKPLSLREKMMEKLKAARFRYLNEQIYTSSGKDMYKYFKENSEDFKAYHEGYKQQTEKWPMNPLSLIIKRINKKPASLVIADFGCGEAELAQSVKQKVHSFDLVSTNEQVIACDMAHVPLGNASVDIAVFCLSLMGTNLQDYIVEANRVLKTGGMLKIAEVESRFQSVDNFIAGVEKLGFSKVWMDLSHNLFCFLDFKKVSDVKKKKIIPEICLQPCLYKKR